MEKQVSYTFTPEEHLLHIEKLIRKVISETKEKTFEKNIFSINKAAEILNIHATTLSNKIQAGYINTTADGKTISGAEINRFLYQSDKETI